MRKIMTVGGLALACASLAPASAAPANYQDVGATPAPQTELLRAQLRQAEEELRMNQATQAMPDLPEANRIALQKRAAALAIQIQALRNRLLR